nr:hypothetical protein [Candidatus Sigynarchaeota archaeon]
MNLRGQDLKQQCNYLDVFNRVFDLFSRPSPGLSDQATCEVHVAGAEEANVKTLVFTLLAANFVGETRTIVILEGERLTTSRFLRSILDAFPANRVAWDKLGTPAGLIVPDASEPEEQDQEAPGSSTVPARSYNDIRVLVIPNMDEKPRVWKCFSDWNDRDGFTVGYMRGRPPVVCELKLGKPVIVATCEHAASLPAWFRTGAWIVPLQMDDSSKQKSIEDLKHACEPRAWQENQEIKGEISATLDSASRDMHVSIPFIDDLVSILDMGVDNSIAESVRFVNLVSTITLLNGQHRLAYISGSSRFAVAHPDDAINAARLARSCMKQPRSLTPDEQVIIACIKAATRRRKDEIQKAA